LAVFLGRSDTAAGSVLSSARRAMVVDRERFFAAAAGG
jgi:hypothetical protein